MPDAATSPKLAGLLTPARTLLSSDHTPDTVLSKPTKRYPLSSWIAAMLVLILIVGIYIFSLCLTQKGLILNLNEVNVIRAKVSCPDPNIPNSEIPFVHYPTPTTYGREECACSPVRFFAILSMQRSGSGWFETLLNSHINISSHGEIFSVKERRSNISTIVGTLDKVYNLDWYSSASKNECTSAVGLKWMLNQGLMQHHESIVEYFKDKGVSVIFLFRKNLLRRMVSILANEHDRNMKQLNGTHKAHVHSMAEADVLAKFRPAIDINKLIPELKRLDKLATDGLQHFKSTRHILLYYEDLVNNRNKIMNVLEFLRVPKMKLSSQHVKIHRGPLSDQVENWDAVNKTLNGTEFESLLHMDYETKA